MASAVAAIWQARCLAAAVAAVFLNGADLPGIVPWLAALAAAVLIRAAAAWAAEALAGRAAGHIKTALREQLFGHIQRLGPAFTAGERSGELAHTALDGVEALDAYYSQYLPQIVLAASAPLAILAFVFPRDAISGVVLLLTAPLIPVFMLLIGGLGNALTRRQWSTLSRLAAAFLDALQGLTTLKLFGRSREQAAVIAAIGERYRETTMSVLRVSFLSALILELIATLSTAVVAVEIGVRLLYGRLAFEQAFFVLILAPEFYLPLRQLGARFHAGMAGVAAARRIVEILDTPLPAAAEPRSLAGQNDLVSGAGACFSRPAAGFAGCGTVISARSGRLCRPERAAAGDEITLPPPRALSMPGGAATRALPVVLRDVRFTYPGAGGPALDGVSLAIGPGQQVAVVGPTGSGKSTLAYLLLRFGVPQGGAISAGGAPLAGWPAEDWRRNVAWVPQSPYLFWGTVADNIRLARPGASSAEIERAAALAHAADFIAALPQGYDTPIGERGARLSRGQAQRLALARAFLKDAPLLVLDEATANLDPASEALVQAAIERLLAGRSALVIAHRLNTVAAADRIVVLVRGRVAESGTPAELLAADGLYRRMTLAGGESTDAPGAGGEAAQ